MKGGWKGKGNGRINRGREDRKGKEKGGKNLKEREGWKGKGRWKEKGEGRMERKGKIKGETRREDGKREREEKDVWTGKRE